MVRSVEGKHGGYYEAIIQLRLVDEEFCYLLEKACMKDKIYIAKAMDVKNGYDYYVGDNRWAMNFGKHLQRTYGGELHFTRSLFSERDGKKLWRVTVLYRQMPFKKGDRVWYNGEDWDVISLVKGIVLKRGNQRVVVDFKEYTRVRLSE